MTIYLGSISKTTILGDATGRIRFGGSALGDSVNFDSGVGDLRLHLVLDAFAQVTGGGGLPQVPGAARGTIRMRMSGDGFDSSYGEADMEPLLLGMHAYHGDGAATVEGFMESGLKLGLYAEELQGSYGFLVDRRPIVVGLSGLEYLFLGENLRVAQAQAGNATAVLSEMARLSTPAKATFSGLGAAAEHIDFGDRLAVVARVLLEEGFRFSGTAAAQRTAVERVIDGLILSGAVGTVLEAVSAVVAAVAFLDLAQFASQESVQDGLAMAGDASAVVAAAVRLIDSLLLSADGDGVASFVAVVSDALDLAGDAGSTAQLVSLLQDGVSFAMHLDIEDGHYSAYVINTENKGITEYSHYPFNSFAKVGGRYFGMTPDGIRELEGGTDAGSPIAARFRLAMTNLGTGNHKRMIAAYLGYTSTGELRVKAITVDRQNGQKRADYYRLHKQPAVDPVPGRVKIGQGLLSVYWGFEVEAIDGAAFAIDLLDLHPIMVNIRVHGQGGGKR